MTNREFNEQYYESLKQDEIRMLAEDIKNVLSKVDRHKVDIFKLEVNKLLGLLR